MSDDESDDPTSKTFDMDGTKHRVGDPQCCRIFNPGPKACTHCGGRMHCQAVYGGYYRECESCHEEAY